jgi:hypothetical protein
MFFTLEESTVTLYRLKLGSATLAALRVAATAAEAADLLVNQQVAAVGTLSGHVLDRGIGEVGHTQTLGWSLSCFEAPAPPLYNRITVGRAI